jgi:hypothetical protein
MIVIYSQVVINTTVCPPKKVPSIEIILLLSFFLGHTVDHTGIHNYAFYLTGLSS